MSGKNQTYGNPSIDGILIKLYAPHENEPEFVDRQETIQSIV